MNKLTKTLPSGASLEIDLAEFQDAENLLSVVMKELEGVDIAFGVKAENLQDFLNMDIGDSALNTIKNIFARIISSKEIKAAVNPCLGRVLYNNQKIGMDTFKDSTSRGDYLLIMKEVLWFNLSPFLTNLSSLWSDVKTKTTGSQK